MKRRTKLLCGAAALLAVLLAGLALWQRENLKAVSAAVKYSSEELEEKLADNQQRIQEAVTAAPEISVRDVTEEERQALRDGALTREELAGRLVGTEQPAAAAQGSQSGENGTAPAAETPAESGYEKALSALIAEVYVLREEYTAALDDMYDAAKADYRAIPPEKRTNSELMKLASGYLSKASQLEKECDRKMDAIIADLEQLIRDNGGDMSLADTVFDTYVNEKSLKKAWYMSKLEKRGLI
ncbi:MAG: hypothetical protein Q4C45_06855 [Oscillospiraceae bacterium]|nr:hypothetical protein [Oscillospiraceae bacterium]